MCFRRPGHYRRTNDLPHRAPRLAGPRQSTGPRRADCGARNYRDSGIQVTSSRHKTSTQGRGARSTNTRIDLESTANRLDLRDYLTAITARDPQLVDALREAGVAAGRFCRMLDRYGGVWIYTLTVLDQIRDHGRSPVEVDQLPVQLPVGLAELAPQV
jgi:hypothetical protein